LVRQPFNLGTCQRREAADSILEKDAGRGNLAPIINLGQEFIETRERGGLGLGRQYGATGNASETPPGRIDDAGGVSTAEEEDPLSELGLIPCGALEPIAA
jgi:hypothetical protein